MHTKSKGLKTTDMSATPGSKSSPKSNPLFFVQTSTLAKMFLLQYIHIYIRNDGPQLV